MIKGQQHQLAAGAQAIDQIAHALDVAGIDASRRVVGAAGVQVEQALGKFDRMQHALHARVDPGAVPRVADSGEVGVAIPDLRGVDAIPGGGHQFMPGQRARQRGQTGVGDALLGPPAPCTRAGQRGTAESSQQKVAPFGARYRHAAMIAE